MIAPPSSAIEKSLQPAGKSIATALGLGSAGATAITLGLALPITLGLGLLAAHDKRVKQAKDENEAMNNAVTSFDSDLKQVFDAVNRGAMTPDDGVTALTAMHDAFWSYVKPYQMAAIPCPPQSGNGCYAAQSSAPTKKAGICDKKCTAACCVGCNVIVPVITQSIKLFQSGKAGSVSVCEIYGSKFGGQQRTAYSLTYTPLPIIDTVEGQIANLLGFGQSPGGSVGVAQKQVQEKTKRNLIFVAAGVIGLFFAAIFLKR